MTTFTGKCTLPAWLPLDLMAYPKYIKLAPHSGHLSPVGGLSHRSGKGAS